MVRGYVSRLWPGLFHVFSPTCASPILPSYLIRAPVAGFIGLLLLVLLRGIRLLRQETSIRARLICLLQVFGFLGFYVLDLFSSASSSHVLIFVFVFCGFVLLFLVPSGVSVSFSVLSLFYDDNRMGVVVVFIIIIIIIIIMYVMFFFHHVLLHVFIFIFKLAFHG